MFPILQIARVNLQQMLVSPCTLEVQIKLIETNLSSVILAGARQFHFPIYYDPTGTLYQENAGLKIANQSANVSATDAKWTYPGTCCFTPQLLALSHNELRALKPGTSDYQSLLRSVTQLAYVMYKTS